MSERRLTLVELAAKTAARVRARGAGEVVGELRKVATLAAASDEILTFLMREAGGEAPTREDVRLREASAAEGHRYARDIGTDSASTFGRRLTEGTSCWLVERGDQILHASWVTTTKAWTSELRSFVTPPPGDAYVYESFTRPETRGQGIYPFALHAICAELGQRGVQRVWVAVEFGNRASRKAIGKAGFEEAFEIRYRRRRGRLHVEPATGPMALEGQKMVPSTKA